MHKTYTIMFWISILMVVFSVVMIFIFGLKFGVDFRGGSVMELNFKNGRPDIETISKTLDDKDALFSPSGTNDLIIRTRELTESNHQAILRKLNSAFPSSGLAEKKFDSVGPIIGNELKSKSVKAMILVLISIMIYIAIVFRKMNLGYVSKFARSLHLGYFRLKCGVPAQLNVFIHQLLCVAANFVQHL